MAEVAEEEEILQTPEGTPITVNTTAGREVIIKYSDDCYVAATLAKHEGTVETVTALVSCVLTIADMRYGGLKESRQRIAAMYGMEVTGT